MSLHQKKIIPARPSSGILQLVTRLRELISSARLRHELSWTHLHGNEKHFASRYRLVLPREAALRAELDREQHLLMEGKGIRP